MSNFYVGFGRVNITPDFPAPLSGYGSEQYRFHDRVLNELYYSAVAFTGTNGNTLLLTTYDNVWVPKPIRDDIAARVHKELGVDPAYFHLSATHTHSSIDLGFDREDVRSYVEQLKQKAVKACRLALEERKQAEIYVGETKTEGLNFVRHYYRADGSAAGDNFGVGNKSPIARHITEADNTLRLIKFVRTNDDGTPARDVAIINWQAHDHLTGGRDKKDLAADWSAAMCSYLEGGHDCFAVFFQGCGANINPKSYIASENRTTNYMEHGRLLAGYVNEIYDNEKLKKVKAGNVLSLTENLRAYINRAGTDQAEEARRVIEYRNAHGVDKECWRIALENGLHSPYQAGMILARSRIKEDYRDIPVSVYRIGDVGWASAPFELFDQTGREIREGSPFEMTLTQGYTDGHNYYLPTAAAFDYGCYEADITLYAKGTAENLRDKLIEMLKKTHRML